MDAIFECIFKGLFGCVPVLCEFLCQNLGPLLASMAECMFQCVRVGCAPLIELLCNCWCQSFWFGYGSRRDTYDGCLYIILFLILSSIVIGTLALGIYALSQYVQDFNPTVAAGVACAILNEKITGQFFSALPVTFGRSKGLRIVGTNGTLTQSPVTVVNRCFNENRGSAKFYVGGQYAAYSKIDKKLYSCTGNVTYQFQYGSTLRVLNADNSLLASTDVMPATSSTATFKSANNEAVAILSPSASGSGFDIRILSSGSPAAAPLILLAAAAFAHFSSTGYDECNGFVLAGGIVDLILLSILFSFLVYMIIQWRRKRDRLPSTRYYESVVVAEPPPLLPPRAASNPVVYQYPSASAPPLDYQEFPPHKPQRALTSDRTGLLFQEDEDSTRTDEGRQQPVPAHSTPVAASAMPVQSQPLQFQSTPEHVDLREALKSVGYTKLKRYLVLHNVTVGHTLLKDELVTLAIIYRRQIDFTPLLAEFSNGFSPQ